VDRAATGIGLCTATELLKRGYRVFAGALPDQDVTALTASRNPDLQVVRSDITDSASIQQAVVQVGDAVGEEGLSILINNAGVAHIAAGVLAGIRLEDARRLFDINVFGTLRVTQNFLPLLHRARQARILNLSSGAVRVPVPGAGVYNMSKFAIEGLTKTLRYELAPFGIQVTCIEPGGVRTPMTAGAEANMERNWGDMSSEIRALYEPALKGVNANLVRRLDQANDPELIAKRIADVLEIPKMKPRYVAGKEVRFLPLIQGLLSEAMFEDILMREFGLRWGSAVEGNV